MNIDLHPVPRFRMCGTNSSTTSSRPAEGDIYLTDIGCLCNETKSVCKVDYSSHCILVELQALLLVCFFNWNCGMRERPTIRGEFELERGYLWVCHTLMNIHTYIHTWVNCVSS
jgi:hypothetical protein